TPAKARPKAERLTGPCNVRAQLRLDAAAGGVFASRDSHHSCVNDRGGEGEPSRAIGSLAALPCAAFLATTKAISATVGVSQISAMLSVSANSALIRP